MDAGGTNPIIDTNRKSGNDNLPDLNQTAQTGQFRNGSGWGGNTSSKVFDSSGLAAFEFKVGMQPGSNYRTILSVGGNQDFAGVQVSNVDQPGYLGSDNSQTDSIIASEALTVWRRLWVENDSMKAVNDTGGAGANFFPVTINYVVEDSLAPIPNAGAVFVSEQIPNSQDQYENGFFRPASGGEWKVYGHRRLPNDSHIITWGVPAGISGEAKLFDDDGRGLIVPQLPRLDLVDEQMKAYFRPAFIQITDAAAYNPAKLLNFKPNEDVFPTGTTLNDTRDLIDVPSLWVCTIIAAYQGPEDNDLDPEGGDETERYGETGGFDGNDQFAAIFVETCREAYRDGINSPNNQLAVTRRLQLDRFIIAVASHEMGHFPGVQDPEEDHAEGKLMSAGLSGVSLSTPESSTFHPKTILRFRKSKRWAD